MRRQDVPSAMFVVSFYANIPNARLYVLYVALGPRVTTTM